MRVAADGGMQTTETIDVPADADYFPTGISVIADGRGVWAYEPGDGLAVNGVVVRRVPATGTTSPLFELVAQVPGVGVEVDGVALANSANAFALVGSTFDDGVERNAWVLVAGY